MKRISIAVLMIMHCMLLFAQPPAQNIRGRVTDRDSKAPIPFATIVLPGTDPLIGTISDGDGNFILEQVPVGRYDIGITYTGFEPVLIREITHTSSKETIIHISMKERVTTLGEVVVVPRVNKEAPLNTMATVSARMLSVEEAKRYAGGFDDPARLASSFAGVASSVANNGIVVRGNAPKSLQWKMEGVEIPNPNHFADLSAFGGGGLTALSSQMLANSDFFTGAFPAEYNNALSGVFDIFMRTGNAETHEHTFQLGAIGIDVSSEGPFKKGGNSSYLFNYRYSTLALVSPLLPDDAQGTSYQDLSFKLNFPARKAGVFSLWGIGLIDRSGQKAETDSTKWFYLQDMEEGSARQHMGAAGLSHALLISKNTNLQTTLAATVSGLQWNTRRMNKGLSLQDRSQIGNSNWNLVLASSLNRKFSARHFNKTGFTLTGLRYKMLLKDAGDQGQPLQTIVDETGFSSLLSAYTSSSWHLSSSWTVNMGLNAQLFTLNNQYTLEPRLGIRHQLSEVQHIGLAYGLHSRLERLNYYFTQTPNNGNSPGNRGLDFTKAHHLVLSYGIKISKNILLKAEPYYQHLYSVPVIPNSSFSFINLQDQWLLNDQLVNRGKGRNYGLDLTVEKYLSEGYYYLATASLFNSRYTGGDGIWRNTRFNRHYLLNLLAGKEWFVGSNRQNLIGLNARLTLQGGDRYTPVNNAASVQEREVVYQESSAFSRQLPPSFMAHFTASYTINRPRRTHEIALKVLNATAYGDFFGYRYNFIHNRVEEHREAIMIPNLSYKIEF